MALPRTHQPDYALMGITFVLIAFGLVMLSSAGAVVGFQRFGSADYFLRRQLVNFALGLVAFLLCVRLDYHLFRRYAVPLLAVSVLLLLLVLIPGVGFSAGGAQRWISLGGFLLQPSEFTKLTFLLYLAVLFEKRGKGIRDVSTGLLPFIVTLGVIAALILKQPDLGTVIILCLMSGVVYFAAGAPVVHVFGLIVSAVAGLLLLVKVAPYRADRLMVFLNPQIDPQGKGYHINQALLAIGSGGIFGLGLGNSRQKYNYLPEVTSDSIFAVIAEELGFLLVAGLIAAFCFFLIRGLRIAHAAPDAFGRSVAVGITCGIVLQAFINMAALSGLLPLTGITLPFISAGGSSLLVSMAAVGILVNISRQTKG